MIGFEGTPANPSLHTGLCQTPMHQLEDFFFLQGVTAAKYKAKHLR
jgi:hypothetical protein